MTKKMKGSARTQRPTLTPLDLVMVCHGGDQIQDHAEYPDTFEVPPNMEIIFYVRERHGAISHIETPINVCRGAIAPQDSYTSRHECPNYLLYTEDQPQDGIFVCNDFPDDFNIHNFPASVYNFPGGRTLGHIVSDLRDHYTRNSITLRCYFCRSNDDDDLDDIGDSLLDHGDWGEGLEQGEQLWDHGEQGWGHGDQGWGHGDQGWGHGDQGWGHGDQGEQGLEGMDFGGKRKTKRKKTKRKTKKYINK